MSRDQAEKAERKAEKADSKALKGMTKAEEHVHEANKELERAQAKRDQGGFSVQSVLYSDLSNADIIHAPAAREAQKAAKEVEIKKEHHAVVSDKLQSQKAQLVSGNPLHVHSNVQPELMDYCINLSPVCFVTFT